MGYLVLNLKDDSFLISRHVIVKENTFPFKDDNKSENPNNTVPELNFYDILLQYDSTMRSSLNSGTQSQDSFSSKKNITRPQINSSGHTNPITNNNIIDPVIPESSYSDGNNHQSCSPEVNNLQTTPISDQECMITLDHQPINLP